MATFTKVNDFVEAVAEKKHNLGSDQLKVALSNTAPGSETHNPTSDGYGVLANVTQISYTNLSGANPQNITTSSSAQTSGTYKLVLTDLTLTAAGDVGPFRYVYIYNDTATNDDLIGLYDYGSSITLHAAETLLLDFDAANGVLQLV
jgi:hypothetical protein